MGCGPKGGDKDYSAGLLEGFCLAGVGASLQIRPAAPREGRGGGSHCLLGQ